MFLTHNICRFLDWNSKHKKDKYIFNYFDIPRKVHVKKYIL